MPRSPAGLDAGGQVTRVVPPETRFTQGPHEVTQSFEAEEIQTLIRDLEARLLRLPDLPTDAGLFRRIMPLVNADVILLLHALDQLFDQFIELLHLHLLQPLAHLLVE